MSRTLVSTVALFGAMVLAVACSKNGKGSARFNADRSNPKASGDNKGSNDPSVTKPGTPVETKLVKNLSSQDGGFKDAVRGAFDVYAELVCFQLVEREGVQMVQIFNEI